MTGKLEGLLAISTNTITNPFCLKMHAAGKKSICSHCYSHSMLNTYRKNMQACLQRNSDILSRAPLAAHEVPILKVPSIRINAHGELINMMHLRNIMIIAYTNPATTVVLWTKRKDIVSRMFNKMPRPANLILIFSNARIGHIMAKPPRHFNRTFNNVPENQDKARQNCTGQKCRDCLLCYTPDNGVTTIIEKVKKY
tara:strand:- start:752 stop:1342 length:591 start_codon:yes stop_codon:yes gene_type:complete